MDVVHTFIPFNCKERMICEKWKIRVHVNRQGNFGIFTCIASFDLNWFMGCCVCMLARCSLSFIFKIFTSWYACWFIRQSCSSWNLGFCWIGYNCLKLTTMVSLMDGSDWFYTRCTMYTVGLHVFKNNLTVWVNVHVHTEIFSFQCIHSLTLIVHQYHAVFLSCICTLCLCVSNAILNIGFLLCFHSHL